MAFIPGNQFCDVVPHCPERRLLFLSHFFVPRPYCSPSIEEENKKNRNKIGAKMKTLEAKPFDQNAEN